MSRNDRPGIGGPGDAAAGTPRAGSERAVLLVVILLALAFMGLQLAQILHMRQARPGGRAVGDGKDPATYGFDLTPCLVPSSEIVASGMPRDGVQAMSLPAVIGVDRLEVIRRKRRSAYLVSSDRVIGVEIGGHARAYPLRVMNWHEVVNDTLGGRPIAATYSPLCDAVVVFDRTVRGETLRFGVSGLLYNSNTLMYDVRPPVGKESLWSQLQRRAIAGPAAAAGESLEVIPSYLGVWSDWRRGHPATTVLAPEDRGMYERYKMDVYGTYFGTDRLRFPVHPLPPDPQEYKRRVAVDESGQAVFLPGGDPGAQVPRTGVFHSFYFAWFAMHPDRPVFGR